MRVLAGLALGFFLIGLYVGLGLAIHAPWLCHK